MNSWLKISKSRYDGVIFDLDGVITRTAKVHANAWKQLFDEYLKKHSNGNWRPFDKDSDYRLYVDGKPRYRGVKSFLESRGIDLPNGSPDDDADQETVYGLGNRKNQIFQKVLEKEGVEVYGPAVRLVREVLAGKMKTAVVSSSKNCRKVLEVTGISDLFQERVDGVDAETLDLKGKPSPDIYLVACKRLGIDPLRAVVVEDAISGVKAGRRGHFGLVIGVDRTGHTEDLRAAGADAVVKSLAAVRVINSVDDDQNIPPSALASTKEIISRIEGRKIVVFLDYDGTLTPIVNDPEKAFLPNSMLEVLKRVADSFPLAVISGRDLPDIRELVGMEEIYYAGSHGFDIAGPEGMRTQHQKGTRYLSSLDHAEKELKEKAKPISGARIERKRFSIAIHYRNVQEDEVASLKKVVEEVAGHHSDLRQSEGKKVLELQPKIDWHKGKAVLWLLDKLGLNKADVVPFYLGDDVTDEDAFKTLRDRGLGIVVMDKPRPTAAQYRLNDPDEVEQFLTRLVLMREGGDS